MGGSRSPRSATIAAFVAATLILGATSIVATPAVDAKKPKADGVVDCPAKVGSYPLDKVRAAPEVHTQNCYYDRPKKKGWAILTVDWWPDEDGERRGCETREPALTDLPGVKGRAAQLTSPTRNVRGIVSLADEARVSLADAQAPLQRLIRAAEPLGHPCVPAETPVTGPGPSCPLLLPGDLVRTDWYAGDPQVAGALGDGSDGRFGLRCLYLPAYDSDEGGGIVRVQWLEGDPGANYLCTPETREWRGSVVSRAGYHPVEVEMDQEFLERWGGQALADALVAAAAQRTQPCPDAPDGPAPYADATLPIPATTGAAPTDPTAIEAGPTETTIVLGGGPGEEPPALGATIELPADDQHELVVGGPDGEVIREEYIGDRGTVSGYGPLVRDADGNWSVLVTIEVGAAPEPTPEPSSEPSTPEPTIGPPSPEPPSPEPTLEPSTAEPSDGPTGTGDDTPASVDQPSRATDAPTAPEPDPGRPPELIGVPKAVAALVAELPPEGAGAVRNLTDHMAVLGEMLDEAGQAEVTIPAGDIASLEALRPDLVKQVRLGSGSIIVTVGLDDIHVPGADEPIKPVLDVLITPIVKDGRIEVRLSRFEDLQTHEVVRALLATLNGYAAHADRDGRFTLVWVTPEGITVTATSKTPE